MNTWEQSSILIAQPLIPKLPEGISPPGNPTTYYNGTHWTFTWEHGRQLATMQTGATTWTNTYNSDGLRTSRTNGTITYNYYYDGSLLTSVSGSNGNIWIFYDANRPVIIKYGDTATYHYELNLQGDVIAILDSSGNRVVEYTYDAWGKILSITGSKKDDLGQANPLRYRGYVYDHETGLYYCQSRYYDPELGRWLNADTFTSTGQGFIGNNMFAYCNNNPVNYGDSNGASPWVILGILALTTALGGIAGCTSKQKLGATASQNDTSSDQELSTKDRITNTIYGAIIGLGAGGLIVSTIGAATTVFAGTGAVSLKAFAMTGKQTFAVGALIYDGVAMIFGPILGVDWEPIEVGP